MRSVAYVGAYLRGIGILAFAMLFPLLVIGTIGTVFVGANIGKNEWLAVWIAIGAGEVALLALAAIQWKNAWVLVRDQPRRILVVVSSLAVAVCLLVAVVLVILSNIRETCGC